MYILTFIHRAHSSGFETVTSKAFDTVENVSKFLQDEWYDEHFEDWDEEDMISKQPTKDDFSVKELECKLEKKQRVILFAPYSKFCCLIPDEVTLSRW